MAAEEVEADEELRELVAQTLENKGVLSKIKAELRAHVFLALEEQDKSQGKQTPANAKLKSFLSTSDGRLAASVLREFLEYFGLHYTASVFEPEAGAYELSDRDEIMEKLKLQEGRDVNTEEPVLAALVRRSTESVQTATITGSKLTSLLSGLGDPPPVHSIVDELPPKVQSTTLGHTQLSSVHSASYTGRMNLSSPTPLENQDPKFLGSGSSSSKFDAPKETDQLRQDKRQSRTRRLDWTVGDNNGGGRHSPGAPLQTPVQGSSKQKGEQLSSLVDGLHLNTGANVGSKEGLPYEDDFVTESIHTDSHVRDGSSSRRYTSKTPDGATVDETLSHSEVTMGDMDFVEPIKSS
jgi:hypothetical protein